MNRQKLHWVLPLVVLGTTGCPDVSQKPPVSFLEHAATRSDSIEHLTAFVVWRDGKLILERYWGGAGPHQPANVKSVSKSFLSALVGIAIEEGRLREDQKVSDILPDYFPPGTDLQKREITVANLLSMQSGLTSVSDNPERYHEWIVQPDLTRAALDEQMEFPPGTHMHYSTGNSQVLSTVLTRVTGMSTFDYARIKLAEPLRIILPKWPQDQTGTFVGGNDMSVSPTAMLRLGILYLDRGRFEGRQVLSERWVEESLTPRGASPDSHYQYGYGWWLKKSGTHDVFFAWGYGGQFIFCVPDQRMVVVFTSDLESGDDPRRLQAIHSVVDEVLVPGIDGGSIN
jgi:CubicO group peptidase (beta-lactamase class C family)